MDLIKSFIFENFKSFSEARLDIESLTILVGTNASGKTNAIEGIKVLSALSTGLEISMLLDGNKSIEVRGGSKGCARFESDCFILGCIFDYKDDYELEYKINIGVTDRILVEEESLIKRKPNIEGNLIFKTKKSNRDSADIKVSYDNGKKGMNPDLKCIRTASILSQLSTKLPNKTKAEKEALACINYAVEHFRDMLFLDPQPGMMRDYTRKTDIELRPNADNISSALYNLCKDQNIKDKILKFISKLPENEIKDVGFIETPIGDVMLSLNETYSPSNSYNTGIKYNSNSNYNRNPIYIEAKRLSDGTLRCLAIITALLSKESGSMVLIEEVDNGIHPNRAKGLVEAISAIAKERNIDVLITTHNPALLNAIGRDELVGVVVCYRNPESGSSEFVHLLDIEKYPELMAKGKLGDLLTKDELTKAIKTEKKNYDVNWLGV